MAVLSILRRCIERRVSGKRHEKEDVFKSAGLEGFYKDLIARLEGVAKDIDVIRSLCQVPSISYGIMHHGELIVERSVGFGQIESKTPPDSESLYTLSSVSKSFVSLGFGLLVDEGKIAWNDTPSQYLSESEFNPEDPRLAREATFNDILRHSSGIDNPVVSLLGPGGKVLVPQRDFIRVLNASPTERHGVPNYNSWVYSNIGYGLVVLVIEKVSGKLFSQFLQERILDPLGMKHTAVTSSQLDSIGNIAYSYVQTSDKSWKKIEHDWTDEKNSPILGMIGIRSSVHDMLVYIAAFMDAYIAAGLSDSPADVSGKHMAGFSVLKSVEKNPIRQIKAIIDGYYWNRPSDDPYGKSAQYHLGWAKVFMPSSMVTWGAWNQTLADWPSSDIDRRFRDENILGRNSEERLLIKTVGVGFCGTCAINWLPKTRTGIVVLTSGLNYGDAADFSASVLLQAVFDLKPKIDIIPMVMHEIQSRKNSFDKIFRDLEEHRDVSAPEASHADYLGEYEGLGITLIVRKSSEEGKMKLCFNNREDSVQRLEYYNQDQYSYWPKTRDEWLADGWLDWDYYLVGLLTFTRDEKSKVFGATWVWEEDADPYLFKKKT